MNRCAHPDCDYRTEGEYCSRSCRADHLVDCERCGEPVPRDEIVRAGDGDVCPACEKRERKAVVLAAVEILFHKEGDDLMFRYPRTREEAEEVVRLLDEGQLVGDRADSLSADPETLHRRAWAWLEGGE